MRLTGIYAVCIAVVFVANAAAASAADPEAGHRRAPESDALTFTYEAPRSEHLSDLFGTLRDARLLEAWTSYVNRALKPLPHGIEAILTECGDANPRYDHDERRIIACYEEADRSFRLLHEAGYETQTQLLTAWIGSMLHQLYHELAHALVAMLELPVLGREEDAADQFAAIALLEHPHGRDLLLGAADYFKELAGIEAERGGDPASAHAFFSQRYFNMLCLAYGANPEVHESLVGQGYLPERRAVACRVEYLRAGHAWGVVLAGVAR